MSPGLQVVIEFLQLTSGWQRPVEHEIAHFLEGRVLREALDAVAAVEEPSVVAVDQARFRPARIHVPEPTPNTIHEGLVV